METQNVREILASAEVLTLIGMPIGDVHGFYVDIVLSSSKYTIRLTGAAIDVLDGTEAFFLTAREFDGVHQWAGIDGSVREAENLLANWNTSGMGGFWVGVRRVRYFRDAEDLKRGLPVQGPFGSASAIEVSAGNQRLVFHATYEYPCAIELATNTVRCDAILASLEEFAPGNAEAIVMETNRDSMG